MLEFGIICQVLNKTQYWENVKNKCAIFLPVGVSTEIKVWEGSLVVYTSAFVF